MDTKSLIRWFAFPSILAGSMLVAIVLFRWTSPAVAVVVSQTMAIVAVIWCEWKSPFDPQWSREHGDVPTDILHALLSGLGTTSFVKILAQGAGVAIAGVLSRLLGGDVWPTHWSFVTQLALALVVVEFAQYWLHRWQHEKDFLWRFHSVHHSAPRLYWLNAARFHPIDIGMLYFLGYLPLIALGASEQLIALFALFDAVFGMLQHGNIDLRLGSLNRVFSMAEVHRWHHSRVLDEANTNYGSNLILWDLLFGTYFLPVDRRPPTDIGISNMPDFPTGYVGHLAVPIGWQRLPRRESAER